MPLSPMGIFHTVLGIGAILAVIVLLWQDKQIVVERSLAKFYLAATVLTSASALVIFRHGDLGAGFEHLGGVLALDVDEASQGVGAVQGALRSAQHFNLFNIKKRRDRTDAA